MLSSMESLQGSSEEQINLNVTSIYFPIEYLSMSLQI